MNRKSRLQNRRLRFDGLDPIHHNKMVARRKYYKRLSKRNSQLRRQFYVLSRAAIESGFNIRDFGSVIQSFGSVIEKTRLGESK